MLYYLLYIIYYIIYYILYIIYCILYITYFILDFLIFFFPAMVAKASAGRHCDSLKLSCESHLVDSPVLLVRV